MEEKPLVSFEQAKAVTEFAQALYSPDMFGVWSPFLSNSLMQGLNNNPETPTVESVRKALADYVNQADNIQSYMEFMNVFDAIFSRILQSYINSLSFDLQLTCSNAYTKSDYESTDYIEDKRRFYNFLTKFDYKAEFRKVLQQVLLHEAYFVSFRKNKHHNSKDMKFALQILPQTYCLMESYWEKGILFSFNMAYWLQAGTDLASYDSSMTEAYNRVFGANADITNYRPSVPLDKRTGTYALYTQLSPLDGYWCFKQNMSNFNTTPFLASLLKSAITDDMVQTLQYNKDIAEAYAILAGEIATFDSAKSGTKSDQMVFSPKTLGGFMAKAKAGLSSTIKIAAMPTENIKWFQYEDKNPTMYSNQLSTTAATGSPIGHVLYSTDRLTAEEVKAGLNEIYQTMRPMYSQFSNFLEFYGNQLTKKYKFKVILDGSNYQFERDARFDKLTKVADKGIVLGSSAWASVLGYTPMDFDRLLDEGKYSDFSSKFQLMLNVNTSKDGGSGGAPRKDTGDLTDSGESSREALE